MNYSRKNTISQQKNDGQSYSLGITQSSGLDRHAVYSRQRVDDFRHNDVASTQSARQYKDATDLICQQAEACAHLIRRLTPLECERLQGFPDWWCRNLGTEEPTEEELAFWADVFETHRKIVTHAKKPKTEKQIRKWLADPYTDSAEYRIWGNGICLANAFFVLAGIAWCAGLEE